MKLKVIQVKKETPTIFALVLKPEEQFDFKPGQYLNLQLDVNDPKGNSRPFSIASSPTEEHILIATRQTNSMFKQKLESLKPGNIIEASGPYGNFILDESKPAVMLSGGIGITPIRSMIKYAADTNNNQMIILFYSNRNPNEIAFRQEFTELERNPDIKIIFSVDNPDESWQDYTGHISEDMIKDNIKNLDKFVFYSCGPPAMVDAMSQLVKSLGVNQSNLKVEHFTGY